LKLNQQLIFLLNGHTITLTHLFSDSTSESQHSFNQETLERLMSTELSGVEKCLEELLFSTPLLGTFGWRPLIDSILSKIQKFCDSDNGGDPAAPNSLSISKLELFGMPPRLISPEILLPWFRDLSLQSSNLNLRPLGSMRFPSFLFDTFLSSKIRQDLPQSPYSMSLLLLHASGSLGQCAIWILVANQMFAHASGPFRDLITARNSVKRDSEEVRGSCQLIFQLSLICSVTIRTFFFLWTTSYSEELTLRHLLSTNGEVFQSSLLNWLVFLFAIKEEFFLSASPSGDEMDPLREFVSQVAQELQYFFSFLLHNSLLQSPNLRSQLLYSTIACSPVEISEMLSLSPSCAYPTTSSSSQKSPQSILETNILPSFQILNDLLLGETTVAMAPLISSFALSILKNLESFCGDLRILSEDSAIFERERVSPGPGRGEFGDRNGAVSLDWIAYASRCSANALAALLFSVSKLLLLSLLSELHVVWFEQQQQEEEEDQEDRWECLLRILTKLYSDFSLKGLFRLDAGEVSAALQSKFSGILWRHYLPTPPTEVVTTENQNNFFWVPSLENFSGEALFSVMSILGQVSYDIYAFPLWQGYCVNKSHSLQWSPPIERFSDLYLLIKFSSDFMGLSISLCRASSYFLFTSLSQLRHPGACHADYLTREQQILHYLADPTADLTSLPLTPYESPPSNDSFFKIPEELLLSFYSDLLKFGLPETELDLSAFPQRLPVATEQQQSQSDQIFFEVREKDVQSYAHLNLCLTALSIQLADIEVWMKVHEKLLELLYRCLDDVSYHIFPFQNLPPELLECSFREILSIQHIFLGTFSLSPETISRDVVTQLSPLVQCEEIHHRCFPPEYSSASPLPPFLHCQHPPPCGVKSFFIPSHDGESDVDPPVDLKNSEYFLPLLFAKLNTTVKLSTKVVNVIQQLFQQLHSQTRAREELSDIASKYLSFCEARSALCLTLSKVFSSDSRSPTGTYRRWLRGSLYNAIAGLEIIENHSSTTTILSMSESLYAEDSNPDHPIIALSTTNNQFLNSSSTAETAAGVPHHPSRYFLLFMKGKLLWKLTQRGEMALPSLYEANMALTKLITGGERIDKRLKALVVCEIQKIRFYSSMRVLWQLHNRPSLATTTVPTPEAPQDSSPEISRLLELLSKGGGRSEMDDAVPVTLATGETEILSNPWSRSTLVCNSCGHPKELSDPEQRQLALDLLMRGEPLSMASESFGSLSAETLIRSFRGVAADSLKELTSCRSWDASDFQSIYLLSRFLCGFALSRLHPDLAWVTSSSDVTLHSSVLLPSFADAMEASLAEMQKLFERKRVQIVAMWSHENTPHRLHQVPLPPSSLPPQLSTDL
jgi:hypothetical protein